MTEIEEEGKMLKNALTPKKSQGDFNKLKSDRDKLSSVIHKMTHLRRSKISPEENTITVNQREWSDSKNTIMNKKSRRRRREKKGKNTSDFKLSFDQQL